MAFNKKLRIGQIDLTDLSSSEIASAADIANVESNVTSFESTALANVDSIQDSVDSASTNIDTVQSNLTTFEGTIDTVQDNVTSETTIVDAYGTYANSTFATQTYVDNAVSGLVSSSPTALDTLNEIAEAMGDDADIDGTLRGKIDTVQDNVTTVISSLDTVQGNLDSFAATTNTSLTSGANTSITANGEALSNTTIFLAAGAGVSLSVNSTSKTVSVDSSVSNITSQVLSVDGTANTFTLPKSVANTSMMVVFYNGLALRPSEYGVSSTTLTINNTDPLISDSELEVRYFDFFDFPGTTTSSGGAYSFQGTSFGYNMSGEGPTSGNVIDKHSFTSDGSSTDVGDLTQTRWQIGGQTSSTHGYASGGISPTAQDTIDKFPFSSDVNASDVGELSKSGGWCGQSSSTHGYHTTNGASDTILKFTFSSDSGGTSIGSLSQNRLSTRGQNSDTHGYTTGGNFPSNGNLNTIDKFPFASDTDASDVGELTTAGYKGGGTGQSSDTHGYSTDGRNPSVSPTSDVIEKFPFASDTSATDVGELSRATAYSIGTSSTTSGYASGGDGAQTTIEKFPFASDTSASNIGNRTVGYGNGAGAQY